MPIYNYKCQTCGYSLERFLPMSEMESPTQEVCPRCHQETIKQIIIRSHVVDPFTVGRIRPSEDWRQFIKRIKKNNPGSNVNER